MSIEDQVAIASPSGQIGFLQRFSDHKSVVRAAVVFFENQYAASHFVSEGLHFSARPDVNVFAIVNGLVILVIAEVFRIGARLDEDQSLTV